MAKNETCKKTLKRCKFHHVVDLRLKLICLLVDRNFANMVHNGIDDGKADSLDCKDSLGNFIKTCDSGVDPWAAAVRVFEAEMGCFRSTRIGMNPYVPWWQQSQPYLISCKDSLGTIASRETSPRDAAKQCLLAFLKKNETMQAAQNLEKPITLSASRNTDTQDTDLKGLPEPA